jgi:hypothetical protein
MLDSTSIKKGVEYGQEWGFEWNVVLLVLSMLQGLDILSCMWVFVQELREVERWR